MFGKNRTHDGVLEKMDGSGVDIRAGIDEDADVLLGGEVGGDAWALDSLKGTELDCCGGNSGTGMTGTDDGVGLTLLDQINGPGDGGIFLATDGIDGRVAHLHNLSGVDDLDPGIRTTKLGQLGLDGRLVSGQEEFADLRILTDRHDGPGDRILRGIVTPHGIEGNPHDPAMATSLRTGAV